MNTQPAFDRCGAALYGFAALAIVTLTTWAAILAAGILK